MSYMVILSLMSPEVQDQFGIYIVRSNTPPPTSPPVSLSRGNRYPWWLGGGLAKKENKMNRGGLHDVETELEAKKRSC